jgi:hypothetical protein
MVAEGIRMRIALVFLWLICTIVLGLPFSIAGDSSLTGAVQSFLSYGLTATGFLLGLLTIFLSRSISDELVHRQIFLVMTKPLPRWQYVAGKWLGITLLNAAFLAASGLTIYGMVHYIRHSRPPIDDRFDKAELENEVLVARHALQARLPDFTPAADQEFDRNVEEGMYQDVPDFDPLKENDRLLRKHEARWRVVGPGDFRIFEFENVLCRRSPDHTIQLRYKAEVTGHPADEVFRALWRFGDPYKGTPVYEMPVRHVVGRFHAIRVPADAVAQDHTLRAYFCNINPFEGEPQYGNVQEFRASDGVEVLFVVGTFEWNLFRALVLMMCKLAFLAAVAVLMVTLFSFPVACLTSLTVYVLAGARQFLSDALDMSSDNYATMFSSLKEFLVQSIMHVFDMLHWVIPDFARFDPVETFVNGRNVSLVWVLQAVSELVLIKAVIVLGLAILFFHRREVAELSF